MSLTKSANRLRPVIRVFVSSTFSDMKYERDTLQEHVFPKLEEMCRKKGFQFQAIDLRWGVSTEAGLDHRAMQICFEELRRAQEISPEPNFLILLGDRYGWRPLPEAISQAEFDQLAAAAKTDSRNQTLTPGTHGKTALQILNEWYRCDNNVVLPDPEETDPDQLPLNHILQPRTQDLNDGRDYKRKMNDPTKDTQDWLDVQAVLWRLINCVFAARWREWITDANWLPHCANVNDQIRLRLPLPQIVRFQASATEQEIWCGALLAANAEKHVIACFREIENLNDYTADEAGDFIDERDGAFNTDSAQRQSDLKAAIERRLGKMNKPVAIPFSRLEREKGKAILRASNSDTMAFCDAVIEKFRPIIEQQIDEYWDSSEAGSPDRALSELKIEQDEHERFGRECCDKNLFVGRDVEQEAIREFLSDNENTWPLVVHGSPGSGKTALMWRAFENIPQTQEPIIRLIGTTPHSSDLRSLLSSLCEELRQRNPTGEALPTEISKLSDEILDHLRSATSDRPLILFLDAIDQLTDMGNGRTLSWLPHGSLPTHVKLVVSCVSDRPASDPAGRPYADLRLRQVPAENFIDLNELSVAEARMLLFDRLLPNASRKVTGIQRRQIEQRLASPACRQPLYLKLLFEEVRLWHSWTLAPVLGESVPALLEQLFQRLSLMTNHGPMLVNCVLGYLSASRHGLAENEIAEILFADAEYRVELNNTSEITRHQLPRNSKSIPIVLWSRLRFDLGPYLTERSAPGANVLTFYHRQVAEWAYEQSLSVAQKFRYHHRLANYFSAATSLCESVQHQPVTVDEWLLPRTPRQANIRKLDELPWQLHESQEWQGLQELLCTLDCFLYLCSHAGGRSDLYRYWRSAEVQRPPSIAYKDVVEKWRANKLYPLALSELARFHESRYSYSDAEEIYRRLLTYDEEVFGAESVPVARDLNNLADNLRKSNRPWEAEPLSRRALAICERVHGVTHLRTAEVLNNLGVMLLAVQQWDEAATCLRRALSILGLAPESRPDPKNPTRNNLALALQAMGEFGEAETLFRSVLQSFVVEYGVSSPEFATAQINWAGFLADSGRNAESEVAVRDALSVDEAFYGPDHPEVARDLLQLAIVLIQRNTYREAEASLMRAINIYEGGGYHSDLHLAEAYCYLSTIQAREKKGFSAAESSLRHAMNLDEQYRSLRHPHFPHVVSLLGTLFARMGRTAQAEECLRESMRLCEQATGNDNFAFADEQYRLASFLAQIGRIEEAAELASLALTLDESRGMSSVASAVVARFTLGVLLGNQEKWDISDRLLRQVLRATERRYGSDHHEVAQVLYQIALIDYRANRLGRIESLLRRSLAVHENTRRENTLVADVLNLLAQLFQAQQKYDEAESMMRRALAIDERELGPWDLNVARDFNNLGRLLQTCGRLREAELMLRRPLEIFFRYRITTGKDAPHLRWAIENYSRLLGISGHSDSQIRAKLEEVFRSVN